MDRGRTHNRQHLLSSWASGVRIGLTAALHVVTPDSALFFSTQSRKHKTQRRPIPNDQKGETARTRKDN